MDKDKSLVMSDKIRKEDKYISSENLQKLYDLIDNARDKAYIMYHAETGLRVQDVVKTEIEHVNWDQQFTLTFDWKKDQWRQVYWPLKVKASLQQWLKVRQHLEVHKEMRQYLFPFTEKTANRILQRWAEKLGLPHAELMSSHWLRHTFIRLSRQAGRDIVAVKQNTGDSYKTLLEWYSGLSSEDMHAEIDGKPLIR